jgi:pimeloyl-ACP methyl ester carboxylesterase
MPMLARPCGDIRYDVTGPAGVPAMASGGIPQGQQIAPWASTATPLLLSHGFGATSAMFAANVPALARRCRVTTWDLRGHGASQSPPEPACYPASNALADMAALLDEVGAGRAVLAGHSLGGYLSLAFTLAHPDRIAGLVLIGTGPGFRNDEARAAWNRRAEATASRLDRDGLAALGDSSELHTNGHRDVGGLVLAARGTLTQHDAHVIDGLPAITVPALIVVGEHDTHFLAAADYMTGKIPAARKVVIAGAGHAPNVDRPEKVNAELLAFLAELGSVA